LLQAMSSDFFNNLEPLLKLLKCSAHSWVSFSRFSRVFWYYIFSFDKIVGFPANHPFSRMFSTSYSLLSLTDVSMAWSGMNWLQHWSMNAWNTECICISLVSLLIA
jgi:hypothetical protein